MFENGEVFEAYAMIDFNHFLLNQMQKQLESSKSDSHMAHFRKECKAIIKSLIEHKKFIEADYSWDEKMLNELQNLEPSVATDDTQRKEPTPNK